MVFQLATSKSFGKLDPRFLTYQIYQILREGEGRRGGGKGGREANEFPWKRLSMLPSSTMQHCSDSRIAYFSFLLFPN